MLNFEKDCKLNHIETINDYIYSISMELDKDDNLKIVNHISTEFRNTIFVRKEHIETFIDDIKKLYKYKNDMNLQGEKINV